MELLDGLDADSLVRRFGPIPAERAIHLLRQVCHSLSEAESCGLVHRDIKPANIFLCRYGEEYDFVKVLDFGIVKALRDAAATSTAPHPARTSCRARRRSSRPSRRWAGRVDGRADIYATGCVAYWLLTGQFVFTADTPMGLLMQHVQARPAPPSARTELPIPAALDQLVLACLAKDPADRPQSARELSRRLAEVEGASAWTQDRARSGGPRTSRRGCSRGRGSRSRRGTAGREVELLASLELTRATLHLSSARAASPDAGGSPWRWPARDRPARRPLQAPVRPPSGYNFRRATPPRRPACGWESPRRPPGAC